MLTQEEYVQRVLALKDQGWSITEIASAVGYHPATVSKWLKHGGPPEKRIVNPIERVADDRWARRIDKLGPPGMDVGHPLGLPARSCGRTCSIGPTVSMTSASAALAEWKP